MRIYVYENKKKKIITEREINKEHLQKIKFLLNYPHKRRSNMTGYQKLKIENKFLWWYINEVITQYELEKMPDNQAMANEVAMRAIAWAKWKVKELQNDEKK